FIHDSTLAEYRFGKTVVLTDMSRFPNQQVHGEWSLGPAANLYYLLRGTSLKRHDHKKVNVGIGVCRSGGVRPKENNFIRTKFAIEDTAISPYLARGDAPRAVPKWSRHVRMPQPWWLATGGSSHFCHCSESTFQFAGAMCMK